MSWEYNLYNENITNVRKRRRRRRRARQIRRRVFCVAMVCMVCLSGAAGVGRMKEAEEAYMTEQEQTTAGEGQTYSYTEEDVQQERAGAETQKMSVDSQEENGAKAEETEELLAEGFLKSGEYNMETEELPEELQELLEKYPETCDYVMGYSQRAQYQGKSIDLTDDVEEGEVPLLLQWDKRWGYDYYGDKLIGVAGCGPTCMSMAYIYLTGDTDMNPRKMAEFADRNGYNAEAGTRWDFFTDGAAVLGLKGSEMGLSEEEMKAVLDRGKVIICSMSPGDFTRTGHFILIRGYDRNGFWVNDPNSRINSEKQWDFETLHYQIKGLWSIGI